MSAKMTVIEKNQNNDIQAIRKALKDTFRERDAVVDVLLAGLISGKNVFLLGPPGTGKSAIVNALCKSIGGKYFYTLLGKTTTAEEIFGQVSMDALRNSTYERNTKNMAPEANIAFFDEVFKCSSAILNSTLTLMNERTFVNGSTVTKTPLVSVIGASNEIPDGQETAAIYDRFTLKVKVDYIQQDSEMEKLMFGDAVESATLPQITLQDLATSRAAAGKLLFNKGVRALLLELRTAIKKEGLEVSDRKWRQAVEVIQAFALINGHTEVEDSDLEVLEHVLWEKPEDHKTVRRIISKVCNPVGEQVMKITDAIQEIFDNLTQNKIQPADATNKIKTAIKQLEKLGEKKGNPKVDQALDAARATQRRVLKEYLGLE